VGASFDLTLDTSPPQVQWGSVLVEAGQVHVPYQLDEPALVDAPYQDTLTGTELPVTITQAELQLILQAGISGGYITVHAEDSVGNATSYMLAVTDVGSGFPGWISLTVAGYVSVTGPGHIDSGMPGHLVPTGPGHRASVPVGHIDH
jgi:hypothetical protein